MLPHRPEPRAPLEELVIELEVAVPAGDEAPFHLGVAIDSLDGWSLFGATTHWDGLDPITARDTVTVRCRVPSLPLSGGRYVLSGFVLDETGLAIYDQVRMADKLVVQGPAWTPALLMLEHRWERC